MRTVREDIGLLRKKASDCEVIARQAAVAEIRHLNLMRAKLYYELVEEAEAAFWRERVAAFRMGSLDR